MSLFSTWLCPQDGPQRKRFKSCQFTFSVMPAVRSSLDWCVFHLTTLHFNLITNSYFAINCRFQTHSSHSSIRIRKTTANTRHSSTPCSSIRSSRYWAPPSLWPDLFTFSATETEPNVQLRMELLVKMPQIKFHPDNMLLFASFLSPSLWLT
jgi:hypothetical protein